MLSTLSPLTPAHLQPCSCVQQRKAADTLQHQLWLLLQVKYVGRVEVGGGVDVAVAARAHHQVAIP